MGLGIAWNFLDMPKTAIFVLHLINDDLACRGLCCARLLSIRMSRLCFIDPPVAAASNTIELLEGFRQVGGSGFGY